MNVIKNGIVVAVLLVVGYGAHVVLNRPVVSDSESPEGITPLGDMVDMSNIQSLQPEMDLGTPETKALDKGQPATPTVDAVTENTTANSNIPELETDIDWEADVATAGNSAVDEAANEYVDLPPPESDNQPDHDTVDGNTEPYTANADLMESLWQSVKGHLDRDDLASALFALSAAYASPDTTSQQRDEMKPLLDQLAGSVIYSRQHLIEPPYTVQQGETLKEIARKYQVPDRFLANINGMDPNTEPAAGETLKVVAGPFRANTSISEQELTLYLGRYYAGRFPIRVGEDSPPEDTSLVVVEKLSDQPYVDPQSGQRIQSGDSHNPYGQVWIGLAASDQGQQESAKFSIHGKGEACPADDTRGSIGLNPEDAKDLRAILTIGSTVRIVR